MNSETRVVTKTIRPSFIESILGKRPSSRTIKKTPTNTDGQQAGGDDDDDENIVTRVELTKGELNSDMITFEDEDKKAKRERRNRDPNELPQSMIERYGSAIKLTKKE